MAEPIKKIETKTFSEEKVKSIYDAMVDQGYEDSYDDFKKGFLAEGQTGYENRKSIYDMFKEGDGDVGDTYEEFMDRLLTGKESRTVDANASQKPNQPKPTGNKTASAGAHQNAQAQQQGIPSQYVTPSKDPNETVQKLLSGDKVSATNNMPPQASRNNPTPQQNVMPLEQRKRLWTWQNITIPTTQAEYKAFMKRLKDENKHVLERNDPDEIEAFQGFVDNLSKERIRVRQGDKVAVKTGNRAFGEGDGLEVWNFGFSKADFPTKLQGQDYVLTLRTMAQAKPIYNLEYNVKDPEVRKDYEVLSWQGQGKGSLPYTVTDYMIDASPKDKARYYNLYAAYIYDQTGEIPDWVDYQDALKIRSLNKSTLEKESQEFTRLAESTKKMRKVRGSDSVADFYNEQFNYKNGDPRVTNKANYAPIVSVDGSFQMPVAYTTGRPKVADNRAAYNKLFSQSNEGLVDNNGKPNLEKLPTGRAYAVPDITNAERYYANVPKWEDLSDAQKASYKDELDYIEQTMNGQAKQGVYYVDKGENVEAKWLQYNKGLAQSQYNLLTNREKMQAALKQAKAVYNQLNKAYQSSMIDVASPTGVYFQHGNTRIKAVLDRFKEFIEVAPRYLENRHYSAALQFWNGLTDLDGLTFGLTGLADAAAMNQAANNPPEELVKELGSKKAAEKVIATAIAMKNKTEEIKNELGAYGEAHSLGALMQFFFMSSMPLFRASDAVGGFVTRRTARLLSKMSKGLGKLTPKASARLAEEGTRLVDVGFRDGMRAAAQEGGLCGASTYALGRVGEPVRFVTSQALGKGVQGSLEGAVLSVPKVYADVYNNRTGQANITAETRHGIEVDSEHPFTHYGLKTDKEVAKDAFWREWSQWVGMRLGEVVGGPLSRAVDGKVAAGAKKAWDATMGKFVNGSSYTKISGFFSKLKNSAEIGKSVSDLGKYVAGNMKRAGMGGTMTFYAQTNLSEMLNAMTVGDVKWDQIASIPEQVDKLWGAAVSNAFMVGLHNVVGTAGYYKQKRDLARHLTESDARGLEAWGEADWNGIKSDVETLSQSDKNLQAYAQGVLGNEKLTDAQKNAIMDYVTTVLTQKAFGLIASQGDGSKKPNEFDLRYDDAYNAGYMVKSPDEMSRMRESLDSARKTLAEKMGITAEEVDAAFSDGNKTLGEKYNDAVKSYTEVHNADGTAPKLVEEFKRALDQYFAAMSAQRGVSDALVDSEAEAVRRTDAIIERSTNDKTGMIEHGVDSNGRQCIVVSGDPKSEDKSQMLVVVYVDNGEVRGVPTNEISVTHQSNPQEVKDQQIDAIHANYENTRKSIADGTTLPEQGDKVVLYDGENKKTVTVEGVRQEQTNDGVKRYVEVTTEDGIKRSLPEGVYRLYAKSGFEKTSADWVYGEGRYANETERRNPEEDPEALSQLTEEAPTQSGEGNSQGEAPAEGAAQAEIKEGNIYVDGEGKKYTVKSVDGDKLVAIDSEGKEQTFEDGIFNQMVEGGLLKLESSESEVPTWGIGSTLDINGNEYKVIRVDEENGYVYLEDSNGERTLPWMLSGVIEGLKEGNVRVVEETAEAPKENEGGDVQQGGAPSESAQTGEASSDLATPGSAPSASATPGTAQPEPMPMRTVGKGKNARQEEDWLATSPERGHDYIFKEVGLDADEANAFVENKAAEAKKNLEKVQKNAPKMGTSISEYKAAKAEHEAQVAEAQKAVDYWNGVKAEHAKRAFEAENPAAEEDAVVVEEAHKVDEESQKSSDGNLKPVGKGVFGNIYDQFRGKVKEAFDFLMKHKSGDLLSVFHRSEVGDIDLVWGDKGGGLDHIITKHVGEGKSFATVEEAARAIDDIIKTGKKDFENGDKIVFKKGSKLVTIRKNVREKGKKIADTNWVLTAYDELSADGDVSAIAPANQGQAARTTGKSRSKVTEHSETSQETGDKSEEKTIRGRKQVVRALKKFAESDNILDKINWIHIALRNVKRGDKGAITAEEQAKVDQFLEEIKEQGYEIDDLTGTEYDENQNTKVDGDFIQLEGDEESARYNVKDGQRIVVSVSKPQIIKDGEIVQKADVKVAQREDTPFSRDLYEAKKELGDLQGSGFGKTEKGKKMIESLENEVAELEAKKKAFLEGEAKKNETETSQGNEEKNAEGGQQVEGKGAEDLVAEGVKDGVTEGEKSSGTGDVVSKENGEVEPTARRRKRGGFRTAPPKSKEELFNEEKNKRYTGFYGETLRSSDSLEEALAKFEARLGELDAEYKNWERRVYKKNGNTVVPGEKYGELESGNPMRIDEINENRRQRTLRAIEKEKQEIENYIRTLKERCGIVKGETEPSAEGEKSSGTGEAVPSKEEKSEGSEKAKSTSSETNSLRETESSAQEQTQGASGEVQTENGTLPGRSSGGRRYAEGSGNDAKSVKMRKAAESVAEMLGTKVVWEDTYPANGEYDSKANTIRIAKDAEHPLSFIFGHESLHKVRSMSEDIYQSLLEGVRKFMGDDAFNKKAKGKYDFYNEHEVETSMDDAGEEVVGDAIGRMLHDKDYAEKLAYNLKHPVLSAIRDVLSQIKDAIVKAFGGGSEEARKVNELLRTINKAYRRAVKEAKRQAMEKDGVSSMMDAAKVDGIGEEKEKYNLRTEAEVEKKLRSDIAKERRKKRPAYSWTDEQVNEIVGETKFLIESIDSSLRGNSLYDEWADREPTLRTDWRDGKTVPVVTWSRNNIEYKYDVSADLLCVNNKGMEEVLSSEDMVDLMGRINVGTDAGFTSDDYMRLYETMRDLGINVPCRGCFDAAPRMKMLSSVSRNFAEEVNAVVDERNADPEKFDNELREKANGKKKQAVNGLPVTYTSRADAIRAAVAGDGITEHIDWRQLMSAEGQTSLLAKYGGLFRAWQKTGAGRPKDKLLPEPYTGALTSQTTTIIAPYGKKTPPFRTLLVNQGTSLRRNSHTEMNPILAIDEIQFMRDAYAKNLMVFKYMKELVDVRLFGNMGVKYNMSFFPAFDKNSKVAGLDNEGNYIASEESVGSREFPYIGEDGKQHFDGMRGLEEAQKYVNADCSLSTVVFSIPHLLKVLTDVPTSKDPRGVWGSAIPFHASGGTRHQLAAQGLGIVRAILPGTFKEAYTDYGKGVTNFEDVQNDRFGKGWTILEGVKAGTEVEEGHKLEFANGSHYYNEGLGVHLFSSWYVKDAELSPEELAVLMGDADMSAKQRQRAIRQIRKEKGHDFSIDYNDKVRAIGGDKPYEDAATYYIEELPKIGLIPRFDFRLTDEQFKQMCADAHVDPHHPKLGWVEGRGWSPIDSDAYYSLFCDYGMIDPKTGKYASQRPVGYIDADGNRSFRMPENTAEIIKEGVDQYTRERNREKDMHDDVMREYVKRTVEAGKLSEEEGKAFLDEKGIKYSLREDEDVSSREEDEKTLVGVHNISEDKLRKVLKLGGLANPSIANIDVRKQEHNSYGGISLIMPSRMIDQEKTFFGDAYTPRFPAVDREMSTKGYNNLLRAVKELPEGMRSQMRNAYEVEYLENGNAESLAYWFLHDTGRNPETIGTDMRLSAQSDKSVQDATGNFSLGLDDLNKDQLNALISAYAEKQGVSVEDVLSEEKKNRALCLEASNDESNSNIVRRIRKRYVDEIDQYGLIKSKLESIINDAKHDVYHQGEVDVNRTKERAIMDVRSEGLMDELNRWIEEKDRDFGVEDKLFQGYTYDGRRRYKKATLENISKEMKKQGLNDSESNWGNFHSFVASVLKPVSGLDNIRAKKGNLTSDEEAFSDFEKWGATFTHLTEVLQGEGEYQGWDEGYERLKQIATKKDPKGYALSHYGIELTDSDARALKDMVEAIRKKPSRYFETKFERPVMLNEFAAAVVPKDISADVRKGLEEAGLKVYDYDSKKDGDRKRAFDEAVNSGEGLLYRTSEELNEEYGSRWLDEQTNEDGRHTTQVKNTINSYKKFGDWVKKDSGGREVYVLDASSGLGLGTEWMRKNGINTEDVEPYPSENRIAPTYTSYSDVRKKYDYIISNAVLNVIPDDWRSDLLHNMADKLKVGGKLVINVRGAESIRKQGKEGETRITLDDTSEILVLRPDGSIKAYQKGFTKQELKNWCEKELGEGYSVEIANNKNAGGSYDTAVVVTKNNESGTIGVASEASHPSGSAQATPNSKAKLDIKQDYTKNLSELFKKIAEHGMGAHEFLYNVAKAFGFDKNNFDKSFYQDLNNSIGIRISNHSASTERISNKNKNDEVYGLVVKLSNHRFKSRKDVNYLEYIYYPDKLTSERQQDIVKGLSEFLQTGNYAQLPSPDRVNPSGKFDVMIDGKETSPTAIHQAAIDLARQMHVEGNIEVLTSAEGLTGRQAKAKGWYDQKTRRVTIVLPNNKNVEDVRKTVFHEVVTHKGLRSLVGEENFNIFLDNIYGNAEDKIQRAVDNLSEKKYKGNKRKAMEEYMANLSEDGEFEKPENQKFFHKVKDFILDLLKKAGIKIGFKLTDNDLRYILWRSWNNLKHNGHESIFDKAADVVKRKELGLTDEPRSERGENGIFFRDGVDGKKFSLREGEEEQPSGAAKKDSVKQIVEDTMKRLAKLNEDKNQKKTDAKAEAVAAVAGGLRAINKAMSAQREYDLHTVDSITHLAKEMLKNGLLHGLSDYEASRLFSAATNVHGKKDIKPYVQKVMDIMVNNQLGNLKDGLSKLLAMRGKKVNASGVEVQGGLDLDGQRLADTVWHGLGMTEEDIQEQMTDAQNRMDDENKVIAHNAEVEYQAYQILQSYHDGVVKSKSEEQALRQELKKAKEDYDAKRMSLDDYVEFREATENAIRDNRMERIEAYRSVIAELGGEYGESAQRAKEFRESEKKRIEEIHHNANSDMEGRPADEHHQPTKVDKAANNVLLGILTAPLGTFDQMLRMFGRKNVRGEGYLWNRYMRGWNDSRDNEVKGYRGAIEELDNKVKEVFGKKGMKWSDLFALERKLPKGYVEFMDGGEKKSHELTQGNLLYIYMVNKMTDGKMKLRKMGISEEDVEKIADFIDPRLKQIGDWLQDEFLVKKREKYNEVHEKLFGASMADIDNYFPLKILKNAIAQDTNLEDRGQGDDKVSTIVGSVKKRTRNALPLDVMNADAFAVVLEHLKDMEHFAAFGEWNRDLNTLLSYNRFRTQVQNMASVYGSGKQLWQSFENVCQIAAGVYQKKTNKFDRGLMSVAKGVTGAKVTGRIFTAFKQLTSYPAYLSEANPIYLIRNLVNPVDTYNAWKWSMENLPQLRERWKGRFAGDPILESNRREGGGEKGTWERWRENVIELAAKYGMSPNAFVDALTISMGTHAVYKTRLAKYKKMGYSDEAADKRAKQDASIAYNQTQQSSEGAYMSTIQSDRTWATAMFTAFRNSSISYTRQLYDALRRMKDRFTPGYKGLSVEFMRKQMERDGIDPDKASENAKKEYRRGFARDMVRIGVFGYLLQLTWNMIGYAPYLLFGDDDKKKKEMWSDIFTHTIFGSIEGLVGGDALSAGFNSIWRSAFNGEEFDSSKFAKSMPVASDIDTMWRDWKNKGWQVGVTDVFNILAQSAIGVNPQTLTDAAAAIYDICGADEVTPRECALLVMRIFSCPKSQTDKVYFDELGMTAKEAQKLTVEQIAERYADYKMRSDAPVLSATYDDEEKKGRGKFYREKATDAAKENLGYEVTTKDVADMQNEYAEMKKKVQKIKDLEDEDRAEYLKQMGELVKTPEYRRYKVAAGYNGEMNKLTKKFLRAKTTEERKAVINEMEGARDRWMRIYHGAK